MAGSVVKSSATATFVLEGLEGDRASGVDANQILESQTIDTLETKQTERSARTFRGGRRK
jgi:hypothetical protein